MIEQAFKTISQVRIVNEFIVELAILNYTMFNRRFSLSTALQLSKGDGFIYNDSRVSLSQ